MDKIINRIRNLLKLAKDKGASEHEAATALKMASDLMIRYNIDKVEDEVAPGIIEGNIMEPGDDKWEAMIVAAVSHLYDCHNVNYGLGRYKFQGRPFNVSACEETLPFVLDQVQALYKEGLKAFKGDGRLDKATRGEFRQTFKEACALRIWKTVREIKAAQKNEIPLHKALVVIETMKQEIEAYDKAHGFMPSKRDLVPRKTGFGTGAGYEAGGSVKLQTRVNK